MLYGEVTGQGLWLVADWGVYFMSNGTPPLLTVNPAHRYDEFCAYATNLNPDIPGYEEILLALAPEVEAGCQFIALHLIELWLAGNAGKDLLFITYQQGGIDFQ